MDALRFEVGKTYSILANTTSGRFRAKCVKRTEKTATFEANEKGAAWYMPVFTLRASKMNLIVFFDDLPMEVFSSGKPSSSFRYGVQAFACDAID